MSGIDRRGFLSGLASCAALTGSHALAANVSGAPELRFGVLSDIHVNRPGTEAPLLTALGYFRDQGVDAVLIAGDMADNGRKDELLRVGDCWRKVFPDNRLPDGRHVEKLFVTGNHDACGRADDERNVRSDLAGTWKRAFDEEYEPIWMKTVKGLTFIGAHWQSQAGVRELPAFLRAHAAEISPGKPFFYTQHPHPKDTCIGAWAWGHDDGGSTKALSAFPNAVAFSGHSHYTLTDERSVWQGAFTSINTSTMQYASWDYPLRENGANDPNYSYSGEARRHAMEHVVTWGTRQGLLVSVYGSTLVIGRRDFGRGRPLGDDWVLSVPGGPESSFSARRAKRSAPAFAPDAKVAVMSDAKTVTVSFPAAKTVAKCRVFEYEVTATLVEDDADLVLAQRRVIARDFHLPEADAVRPGDCVFDRAELTWPGHYVFSVRPIECFGRKGAPIVSEPVVLAKREPPKKPPR